MAVDKDTVARIARLARIRMTEAEGEALTGELSDGGQAEAVIKNAPEPAHGFFTVPKVVE